ncbi:DUF7706 family protein [Acinetobacter haemolyticus]|uniref:DUF7706 family protein n=1 Tax=Acinetobacter haemolyticus TaxID=29430 RepID=UPI00325B0AE1
MKLELQDITAAQAMALAQFVKRVGWNEIRVNAANDDEAYLMRDAISKLQDALASNGYAPR